MPEEYLKQTELQESDEMKITYKGNTVWAEPKQSPNIMLDARVVYKMKKIKGGYAPKLILYYDSTFKLITSDTRPAIEKNKYSFNAKRSTTTFLNKNKKPMEPEYMNYARVKYRHFNDGSYIMRYYDMNLKPRCGPDGFIIRQKLDALDIPNAFTVRTIYKIDVKVTLLNNTSNRASVPQISLRKQRFIKLDNLNFGLAFMCQGWHGA